MIGIENGLEDDGIFMCHPCRIRELEEALGTALDIIDNFMDNSPISSEVQDLHDIRDGVN